MAPELPCCKAYMYSTLEVSRTRLRGGTNGVTAHFDHMETSIIYVYGDSTRTSLQGSKKSDLEASRFFFLLLMSMKINQFRKNQE